MPDITQTEIVDRTFEIPQYRIPELEQRMARLAKTAKKLGVEAPAFIEVGEAFRLLTRRKETLRYSERAMRNGQTLAEAIAEVSATSNLEYRIDRYVIVQVSGPAPKLAGWRFLAKLEHTEAGTMIQKIEDVPVPEQYRNAAPACDHCGYDRKRRDTYIVINAEGVTKQVGRTCIKDFTGHHSPEQVAAMCLYFEQLSGCGEFDEDFDDATGGSKRERYFPLHDVLRMAAMCIREYGWVSKLIAEQRYTQSTGSMVLGYLLDRNRPGAKQPPAILSQDEALADTVAEWAKQIEAAPEDDYLWNLSVIANLGVCAFKRVGLAASMIRAYQRAMELIEKREADAKLPTSEWFGEAGKRYELTLKILTSTVLDGNYGAITRHFANQPRRLPIWR